MTTDEACRVIAKHYHGNDGIFAYEAFDDINARFFSGDLPTPLIQWAITGYGGCIGQTKSSDRQPVINLHPSILRPNKNRRDGKDAWGISSKYIGVTYAYDVLLHECMHVHHRYVVKTQNGPTGHNCDEWVNQVNRIAPMLGLDIKAGRSKVKRLPTGETDEKGKQIKKAKRTVDDGCIPFNLVPAFPHSVRQHVGDMSYYENKILPFKCSCNM